MKASILLLSLAAATGCNTTTYKSVNKEGQQVTIVNSRFLWTTEAYDLTFTTNGVTHMSANKSNTDAAAMQAVSQGIINGMASAMSSGVLKP